MLASVASQLKRGQPITEKQATVVEKILNKYIFDISLFFAQDMAAEGQVMQSFIWSTLKRQDV